MPKTIYWWVFTLACVFAFFFSYGRIGPELTFLLAGLLPLWRVNFKMPDIVERHDGPAVIVPDQLVEGYPLPFVHPFIGGLLNHCSIT